MTRSIDDIDMRTRVGTDAWNERHEEDIKQLSAWRRLHMLLPHEEVVKLASPDSSPEKLASIAVELERSQKEVKRLQEKK